MNAVDTKAVKSDKLNVKITEREDEMTGLSTLCYIETSYRFCGLVTFVSGDGVTEYMSLFHADGFEGEQIACDEGVLDWVDINKIQDLNLWRGDKIFLKLIAEKVPFFSLKLVYDGHDGLVSAVLNGTELDLEKV